MLMVMIILKCGEPPFQVLPTFLRMDCCVLGHSETQDRKERIKERGFPFSLWRQDRCRKQRGTKQEPARPLMSVTAIAAHLTVPAVCAKY